MLLNQTQYVGGIIGWILLATPLIAQGIPDAGIASAHSLSIPSPQSMIAQPGNTPTSPANDSPANNYSAQPYEATFPSLETTSHSDADSKSEAGLAAPLVTVTSSLAIVLGLFAGLVWITRKFGGNTIRAGTMPSDVLQSLGSTAIDARTRVIMLRCGNRIVVAAQTPHGVQPLCEITDPREVHELTTACGGQSPMSFADTLATAKSKQADNVQPRSTRGRLFATA